MKKWITAILILSILFISIGCENQKEQAEIETDMTVDAAATEDVETAGIKDRSETPAETPAVSTPTPTPENDFAAGVGGQQELDELEDLLDGLDGDEFDDIDYTE